MEGSLLWGLEIFLGTIFLPQKLSSVDAGPGTGGHPVDTLWPAGKRGGKKTQEPEDLVELLKN